MFPSHQIVTYKMQLLFGPLMEFLPQLEEKMVYIGDYKED